MPDGTIIRGVPEGTSKEQILEMYNARQQTGAETPPAGATPQQPPPIAGVGADYDPTQDMSTGERFLAGIGQGMADFGRRAVNTMLPKSLEPEWASDEAIAEAERLDKALLDTGAGMAGSLVGATAATAPVGGVVGGALKAGSRALPAASRVGTALTKTPVRGAAEGAAVGALASDPGDTGVGAGTGAALGGAIPVVGHALGRSMRGFVKMKPEAMALQAQGIDVPIGLGAEKGLTRTLYRDFLPAIPGGKQLLRQSDEVFDQWRRLVHEDALPKWVKNADDKIDADDVQGTMRKLQKFWDEEAYAEINPMKFHTSASWMGKDGQRTLAGVSPEVRKYFNQQLAELSTKPGEITGANLMKLRRRLSQRGDDFLQSRPEIAREIYSTSEVVDSMLDRQLLASAKPGTKGAGIYERWQQNKEPYANFLDMRRAAAKAAGKEGKYSPLELAKASAARSGEKRAATGAGAMQEPAQFAERGHPAGDRGTGEYLGQAVALGG